MIGPKVNAHKTLRETFGEGSANSGQAFQFQSDGGPRLKGSPVTDAARLAGDSARARCLTGAVKRVAEASIGGAASPSEAHQSQCEPVCSALSSPASGLPAVAVLTLQILPSLPPRTSSASIDAGATSADRTARKLKHAAKRAQTDIGWRDDGR